MRYSRPVRGRSKGVALITAVLITAAIAIAAVAMAAQQTLDTRRTANIIDGDRSYVFALGVESWAMQILMRDRRNNQTDNLHEDWALRLPPITVEGAVVTGHIEDMQGRFNLNNLVKDDKVSPLDMQRFQRLLTVLGFDPNLADAVVDWIDTDSDVTQPAGAEDPQYLRATVPYRAANRPLSVQWSTVHVSRHAWIPIWFAGSRSPSWRFPSRWRSSGSAAGRSSPSYRG